MVAGVGIGGKNPIRIQSMTTSLTHDVEATAYQIMKLADYGCDLARVTVQGKKEAAACEKIKSFLLQKGYTIPLIADIHFYPPAAMEVVEYVDKIRINPGNFLDKRASFKLINFDSAADYEKHLEIIEEGFAPLVLKCKSLKKAMRIGVNHGSLSDRIMSRYGDNPEGMVQSAIEYARVAIKHGFYDLIFSMKSSNPLVMIQAYRLLTDTMDTLGWDFPLHLGVTEAGLGEDGRIKSAIGIGTLLLDGLGDTIRVSLTEDPWEEIAPAKKMVSYSEEYKKTFFSKRPAPAKIMEENVKHQVHLIAPLRNADIQQEEFFEDIGVSLNQGVYARSLKTPQGFFLKEALEGEQNLKKLEILQNLSIPVFSDKDPTVVVIDLEKTPSDLWQEVISTQTQWIVARVTMRSYFLLRSFQEFLKKNKIPAALVCEADYAEKATDCLVEASMDLGSCIVDKIGQGVMLTCKDSLKNHLPLALNILQGCRQRLFKTDYIACPGCGRTLFDLQQVTLHIKEKTAHLPGVKIAVMGCIVNGPGEMADADFGYVGSKTDAVDLYIGKTCVEKNIPSHLACHKLIELIKSQGKWIDPPS